MITDIELLELANNICKLANKNNIYNANIIYELHANENAHSRILRMFLQYDDGTKTYPILKKFIEIKKINNIIANLEIHTPRFSNEQERIDVLIEENPRYAIIIENKIYDASDQNTQLERYIKSIENHGINSSNIYAIYLTKNGEKTIADNSLTQYAKTALDYKDEDNGRFIPLSYQYDILPWLENIVLPNCILKEDLLISALKQYIDYLKNILGIKENKELKNEIMTKIKNELNINTIDECIEVAKQLEDLNGRISNLRDEMACELGNKYIRSKFEKYLHDQNKSYNLECEFSFNYISISVFSTKWENFYFKVNYENPMIYGIVNKDLRQPYTIANNTYFEHNNFKKSGWWPAWKRFDDRDLRHPQNSLFWHKVKEGEFYDYLIKIFEEVINNIGNI